MPLEDKQLRRYCEREIAKFPLDTTRMNVRALNHIIYLEGRVKLMRGAAGAAGASLDKIIEAIRETLLVNAQVREVITTQLMQD